jgi:hypothetical protein
MSKARYSRLNPSAHEHCIAVIATVNATLSSLSDTMHSTRAASTYVGWSRAEMCIVLA